MFRNKNNGCPSCQWHFTSFIFIIALVGTFFKILLRLENSSGLINTSELAEAAATLLALMLILNYLLFRNRLLLLPQLSFNGGLIFSVPNNSMHFITSKPQTLNKRHKKCSNKKTSSTKPQEFLTYLLDNIDKSIVVLDQFDEIIYCNQFARLFFDIGDNQGALYKKGSFPFSQNKLEQIKNHISSGKAWNEEQTIIVDGKETTMIHHLNSLNKNDNSDEIIIVSYDITELTRVRQDAETANAAKSHFLSNITHELRTPMIGILGSVDLLEHTHLNQQQLASVETIRDCGDHLLNLIDDMLEVSKIEIGTLELTPCAVNLPDILKKSASMVDFNLRNKGLLLELEIDNNLPASVMVDEVKLRQVIINLLSNSIKFTPRGGIKITASLSSYSSWLQISVADTGIGIPSNKLDNIFNCFTQVDTSNSRNFGGTGLGLYICKKLVDLMKGDIWVESQEGIGTTFSFRIPFEVGLAEQHEYILNDTPNPPVEDEFSSSFVPISVLLVDDNELNQKLVAQMLINYGFEVITAANGLECLNILQYKNIDIILMDMQMPIMDGYEATRMIRDNKAWAEIPVIAITANSMSGDREKCLASGCSSYLAKPFKSEALVREIKTYLKNQFIKEKNADPLSQQLIAELLPEFMEMMVEILNDLEEAIDLKDLKSIKSISHSLKGTAGMYGFMQISELAALIEKSIIDKNYQRMYKLYQQIVSLTEQYNSQVKSKVVI